MTIPVAPFDPQNFVVEPGTIYVFDFDGVVIDPIENDVYNLPHEPGEECLLARAREAFRVDCAGMKVKYQRHLLYQAALQRNGAESEVGPAFDAFRRASIDSSVFVLTARSGWDATERARRFLDSHGARPVETFHIGRVAKYLQLRQLLDEFIDQRFVYLDDSPERIEEIVDYFNHNYPDETRLAVNSVSRIRPAKSENALRKHFADVMEMAMSDQDDLLARWKRFADASHKEKQWMHERFNWLVLSQAFLFAMLTFASNAQQGQAAQTKITGSIALPSSLKVSPISLVLQPWQSAGHLVIDIHVVLLLTIGLGLLISSLVAIGLVAAGRMHWIWTSELNRLSLLLQRRSGSATPLVPFGTEPHWPARTSSVIAPTLAISFIVIWGILLFYLWNQLPVGGPAVVISVAVTAVALIAIFIWCFDRSNGNAAG